MTCQHEQFELFLQGRVCYWDPVSPAIYQLRTQSGILCLLICLGSLQGEVSCEYSPDGSIMHPTGPNINLIHHRLHNPDGNTHLQIRFWINVWVFLCPRVRLFWGFWMQGQRVRGCCVSRSFLVSAYIKCHNSPDIITKWWAVTNSPTWTAASTVQVLT